jgi:prefoldin subunit 5
MPWWTWIALVFFVAVVAASGVVSFISLRRMRDLEATGNEVARALDEVTSKAEALEARLEHAAERAELLERKMAHLQRSLDRLSVLTWALGDVGKTIADVRRTATLRK